jgi:pimeloyl-ACP methyl ester carboxylesterase
MEHPDEKGKPAKPKRGCRYFLRLLVFGAVSFVVIFLPVWEWAYVDAMTRPAPSQICCRTPANFALPYEEVVIPTPDGISLSGWYIPPRNGAVVIFLHGYGAVRLEMLDRAAALARHGFGALLYDLRAHGESGGTMRAMGWPDAADLSAAVDYLLTRPEVNRQGIGAFGFSIGGQIAIRAAAGDDRIRCVIADDPAYARAEDVPEMPSFSGWLSSKLVIPMDLRLISARAGIPISAGVAEEIGRIAPRPLLLVVSGRGEMSLLLGRHFYSLAGDPKSFWEIPEAGHGGTFVARPKEYGEKMLDFYNRALFIEKMTFYQ